MMRYIPVLLSSLFFSITVHAFEIPVKVEQKCSDLIGKSINYPIRNGKVYVVSSTGFEFLPTDENGVMTLNKKVVNQPIVAYLATAEDTILVGCYSAPTNINTGLVILGAPGAICPQNNCHN